MLTLSAIVATQLSYSHVMSEVIEISDECLSLDKVYWIGKGRKYPKGAQIPIALTYYVDNLQVIPDMIKEEYIPSSNLSIKEFIEKKLPKISYNLPTAKPKLSFREEAPNDAVNIGIHELPPLSWIKGLKEHFGQAVLDDMKSIEDPRYPGSRVPLWWIGLWTELHNVNDTQQDWMKAAQWVEERMHKRLKDLEPEGQLLNHAKKVLSKLRWNEQTDIPGADGIHTSTFTFASYLSDNKMMNTDHINMMFAHLSERAEEDPTTDNFVIIEKLRFMKAIEKVARATKKDEKSERWLARIEDKVRNGDIQAIVLPVHIPDQMHWTTIRIDFEEQEIAYGEFI